MRTTSIKSIYLGEHELKQAIVEYLEKTEPELAQHLYDNCCSMEWTDKSDFAISVDGEIEDEVEKPAPWYGECAHCFGGYSEQECTCAPVHSKMIICDGCGEACNEDESYIITTKSLSGAVICKECLKENNP